MTKFAVENKKLQHYAFKQKRRHPLHVSGPDAE